MSNLITEYFSKLEHDKWRDTACFSPDIEAANQKLFKKGIVADEFIGASPEKAVKDWINERI